MILQPLGDWERNKPKIPMLVYITHRQVLARSCIPSIIIKILKIIKIWAICTRKIVPSNIIHRTKNHNSHQNQWYFRTSKQRTAPKIQEVPTCLAPNKQQQPFRARDGWDKIQCRRLCKPSAADFLRRPIKTFTTRIRLTRPHISKVAWISQITRGQLHITPT